MDKEKKITPVDALAILGIAGLAVFFCTQSFNQGKEINRLEDEKTELQEQLNETSIKLDSYQRGVLDSK